MLVTESRPRDLRWFHAGPLLYGDWGTSRLYVLGLAFFYTAHASVVHLAAIGLLMLGVSWAYTIVCRSFPDGGGVYTAARQLSPTMSVVGATLLLSGYIMTAAISVIEAFHYFGVPHGLVLPLGIVAIVFIGLVNWLGAKSAGRLALLIAFGALAVSGVISLLALPFFFEGLKTIDFVGLGAPTEAWVSFTRICLALAGVEAVANMTGMMNRPVAKTARRTIWPVTIEVVTLNMLFGIALAGLGYAVGGTALVDTQQPHASIVADMDAATREAVRTYRDTAMNVIATESATHAFGADVGVVFGRVAGVLFGLLLLSATNTAVMAMVSVLFAMGQDRELPRSLTKLNYSGVPWVGLIVSVVIPIGVIAVEQDVRVLAELYVLGVCGAITVTLASCALNRDLDIIGWRRALMWGLAIFLASISLTIAVTQPVSTAFSGGLIAVVLGTRFALGAVRKGAPPLPEPEAGWLHEVKEQPFKVDPAKPKIMLAARGRYQSEFAVDLARRRGATLFAIYVRTLRVMDIQPGKVPRVEEDRDAQRALGTTALLAKQAGVDFVPVYVTSADIAGEILDYTVTYGCDTLIMGKSRRSVFARRLEGDVVQRVAADLPDDVALITRSAETPHVMPVTENLDGG